MAEPSTQTPGEQALAEAARIEAARVYGNTCREYRQGDDVKPRKGALSTASVDELVDTAKRRDRGTVRLVRAIERAAS